MSAKALRWMAAAVVVAVLAVPVCAKDYFVKPAIDGGADWQDGETPGTAWESINQGDVRGVLLPGDVVKVLPGTYDISLITSYGTIANNSGSPGSPITYQAEGAVTIITYATPVAGILSAFDIAGTVHDIVIKGFEIVGGAGSTIQEKGIDLNGASGITIRDCTFRDLFNSKYTNAIDMTTEGGSDILIHNNIFRQSVASPVTHGIVSYGGQTGLKVVNNVFSGVGNGIYTYNLDDGVEIRNNIFANCVYGITNDLGGTVINNSTNLYWNNVANDRYGTVPAGAGDVSADPKFVGGDPFDYHLQPGSPAINAGTNVGLPYLQGAPDIGAFESNYATATLNGFVKTPGGAPLAYATVEAVGTALATTTDLNGHFLLGGLSAGTSTIKATFGRASVQDTLTFAPAEEKLHDFAIAPAVAKTFHVKVGGDDGLDGESLDTAWATINNGTANGKVKPGDTVLIHEGSYAQNVTLPGGGAPGYRVTYKAEGAAVIAPASGFVLDLSNASHDLVIDGLELTGSGANRGLGFYGADRIEVKNCWIHDLTPGTVFYLDMTTGGSDDILVHHNVISRSDTRSSYGFIDYGNNTNIRVLHNVFAKMLLGLYVYAQTDPIVVANNIFTDCDYAAANDLGGTVILNSHNLYWGNGLDDRYDTIPVGAGDRFADPMFVGGAPFDYHLQAGSPAAEAGRAVGFAYNGLAPDIGLHETAAVHTPATYYVKPGGDDNANGTTMGTAWATINNGDLKSKILPGDTIIVEAGDYAGAVDPLTSAGATGYPVTYKANGAAKIIAGAGNGINHGNVGHDLVIDGFEITGDEGSTAPQAGVKLNAASNVTVRNCYIHNLSNSLYTNYIDMTSYTDGAGIMVHNNILRHTTSGPMPTAVTTYGGPTTGLQVFNNDMDGMRTGIYLYNVDAGVDIKNNILQNNRFAITNDEGGTVISIGNNLYWNNEANDRYANVPDAATDVTADPLFAGGSPYSYALQAASPAVETGALVGLPFYGLAPDRGAIESTYIGDAPDYAAIADVKGLAVGSPVEFTTAKAVTVGSTVFTDGSFYIEEPDRSSGIKAKPQGAGVPAVVSGERVTLTGVIMQDDNGEKYISVVSASKSAGSPLDALSLNNTAFDRGAPWATVGLWVRTWGRVTAVTPDYIYVDDGSNLDDGTGNGLGIRIMLSGLSAPITKTFTAGTTYVEGVSGVGSLDSGGVLCIRPRGDSDISL